MGGLVTQEAWRLDYQPGGGGGREGWGMGHPGREGAGQQLLMSSCTLFKRGPSGQLCPLPQCVSDYMAETSYIPLSFLSLPSNWIGGVRPSAYLREGQQQMPLSSLASGSSSAQPAIPYILTACFRWVLSSG